MENPFPGRVVYRARGDSRQSGAGVFSNPHRSKSRISEMALVYEARGRRVIVHGSDMVVDQIEVQGHTGLRTPNVFLGRAPAQTHNGAAVLLCLSTPGIKKVSYIVDAHDIRHVDHAR